MVMPSASGWKLAAPRGSWPWIAGIVLGFALLDGVHTQAGFVAEGNPQSWWQLLRETAIFWLVYAACIPLVLLIADRFPLDPRHPRNILIHFAAALCFTYLWVIVLAGTLVPWRPEPPPLIPLLGRLMRFNFALNFLTYCAIVGAMYGVRLYTEARRREVTAAQLEVSLAAARLEALRAQLNPHFLFNTLNAISVLAMKGQHAAVTDTLARLGELLRVSLDDTRPHQVPLSDEVEFLDGYLEILRLRFGDRMVVDQSIEADTLGALVPCMILQPVVENAIVHGISARPGEGRIAIGARRLQDQLVLQVSDNGPGFGAITARGHGIGLRNTRARLEQIYGPAHQLELIDGAEGGAIVRIAIPFVPTHTLAMPA
jgi:signal transduction histidine kinase